MPQVSKDLSLLGRSRLPVEKNIVQIVTKPGGAKGPLGSGESGRFMNPTKFILTSKHAFNVR